MVMQLKRRPTEVSGVKYTGDNLEEIKAFAGDWLGEKDGKPCIHTDEGDMTISTDDTVVCGVKGEFFPVKPDVFELNYEIMDNPSEPSYESLTVKEREEEPESNFAVPGKKKLWIKDVKHTRLAWSMLPRTEGLSSEEKAEAKKRILARAKKLGMDTRKWNTGESASNEAFDGETVVMKPAMDVIDFLLVHTAEESVEVSWSADKAIRNGMDGIDEKSGLTWRDQIGKELCEMTACVLMLNGELTSAGIAPIPLPSTGAGGMLEIAMAEREETLRREFEEGRFTFPPKAHQED